MRFNVSDSRGLNNDATPEATRIARDLPAIRTPQFSNLIRLMKDVTERGRLAVSGLRAPKEDARSLALAFAGVPNESGLSSGVRFQVVIEGRPRELKASLREEVYRIGWEAIVNAYRHSGAKAIEIALEYGAAELRMVVRDNGCGIDRLQLESGAHEHWGLHWMTEHAQRIGSRLRILSRIALGTEVELRVPTVNAFEPDLSAGGFLNVLSASAGVGRA